MTLSKHLKLLAYSAVTWLTFYIVGLPDYYQQWYGWAKVAAVIGLTLVYFPLAQYSLRRFWSDGRHRINARWLALYLTVPLFIYDYLLLAVYKDLGIGFVVPYWYLTFFYFSFWVQFPLVARSMERADQRAVQSPRSVKASLVTQ